MTFIDVNLRNCGRPVDTNGRLINLVRFMRAESHHERIGVGAMPNALSMALFALTLMLASESVTAPYRAFGVGALPGTRPGNIRHVQRSRAPVDATRVSAPVQHVSRDLLATLSGQVWPLSLRPACESANGFPLRTCAVRVGIAKPSDHRKLDSLHQHGRRTRRRIARHAARTQVVFRGADR